MSLTSHSVPPYSLPSADEVKLAVEDDWTQVKDRKEKKKIQNRVAQRTYRHRMKARLGELQSRLEFHEGKGAHLTEPLRGEGTAAGISSGSEGGGNGHGHGNSNNNSNGGALQLQGLTPTTTEDSSPSPRPAEEPQERREMARPTYHNPHNASSGNSPHALFGQPVHLTHCQSPSQVLPPQDQQSAYFPPRQMDHGAKLSQSIMQDCLRFQMQLLDKLNNSMPDEQNFADMSSQRDDMTALFNLQGDLDMDQIGGGGNNHTFSPDSHNMMNFSFNGPHHDIWPCESPASQEVHGRQASIPPPSRTSSQQAETKPMLSTNPAPAASTRPVADMQAPPPPPTPSQTHPHPQPLARDASLDERFESVMERVEAAGFDNFDELATAYYSETFPESSPLAIEQHLSRNRRLPKLFASVFAASQAWTAWERRGFLEEILKTAETMLVAEGRGVQRTLEGSIVSSLLQTTVAAPAPPGTVGGSSSPCPPATSTPPASTTAGQNQGIPAMKRLIENDLPNLWALTTALASENRALRQRERSNTVLATIVMLQCAGRVPKQSLLSLVDACLP
ncbi:hypothetical protein B0T22DRAFT_465282 [Podospora appendiculata]|uniref:BZIP domain-containing protein n=1 Tax=Podospora appendiculata TaxID=314037 RepID=A0AAE1CA97_9PEZI|nr:hypothetical protein B0T22DRAFT_465282 [Podospora appendiculata]